MEAGERRLKPRLLRNLSVRPVCRVGERVYRLAFNLCNSNPATHLLSTCCAPLATNVAGLCSGIRLDRWCKP